MSDVHRPNSVVHVLGTISGHRTLRRRVGDIGEREQLKHTYIHIERVGVEEGDGEGQATAESGQQVVSCP